ncbi:transcriptional regulator, AsnC family [Nakamurella panacisegetis]|uniref:Transcriptional regulator, AsnC family n=1 Tax=Nakamurella panacisegetis TaxID=1090615 RepID=A0A1H0NCF4_9ACTN|nr:Lrp/AsnC family transcriptional regulator [Nakamurella panacisegetis]SDO90323.1 transcriptional regulator, AsnC family [Nakamurella panacisegetis]
MDPLDERIISLLRQDGRATFSAIGRDVGLSTNAVSARVRRLEASGVIAGFTVVLADSRFDDAAGIEAFIDVRLQPDRDSEAFLSWARPVAGVLEAVHVTGPYDYLLRVRLRDMPSLDRFLRLLKREGGAAQTQTRMALR